MLYHFLLRIARADRGRFLSFAALAACSAAALAQSATDAIAEDAATADATTTTWTTIAAEKESFSVSGTQTVRYGANASWITKSVTGSGQCTNTFFGGDPAYGIRKQCQVAGTTETTPPAAQVCTPPVTAASTSGVAPSVGTGTAASCTESALRAAIASHPVVTFNCGATAATIRIAKTIELPTDRNIVIDGGNKVTLDGGATTRIFSAVRANYRTNANTITLQHITLANGKATGTQYVAPDPSNPSCAYGWADGQGGAILVRDVKLRVIDTTFRSNAAATPGPDVGGGAIYAMGSLDVTVVGSTFTGNSGSNSGAVGLLQTNGRFYNSVFQNNVANGTGQNFKGGAATGCPGVGHVDQGGAGGNGGAIGIDGKDDTDVVVCGSSFIGNKANELAGALGRTSNVTARRTTIDRSLFQANTAKSAGAIFVLNSKPLDILATTFSNNVAKGAGAAHLYGSRLNVVNTTFSGNQATAGVGGALMLSASDATGVIRNATFTGNKSTAGLGYFAAAIAGTLNFPVYNTVFANNLTNDGGSPMQCWFTPGTGANDMQWPRNHVVGTAPDTACIGGIVFADPQLGALAANGGPTPTARPSSTSPLRGAGRNCPATDQRGNARNTAQCTIGAVE
ncbi:choice-of-anchor Q domain-containing protein [Piscinibacter sp. XHJ-5]|uniref:choice-of-anchor Q domain-containing protein n=1 Tax=Piscinibacter sp. XHJ-5 TaxID=3037797 RepID=UPI0024534BAE|nr:choice-of-anchor Q domain-containing protein [Piscinibacter sp. XHJ-5]